MALRPDYEVVLWELGFYMDTVAEKGEVLSMSTVGSGAAMDHTLNVAVKSTTAGSTASVASGAYPLGVVTSDVVNIDLSRYSLNAQKAEVQIGMKVPIIRQGWIVTDRLHPNSSAGVGSGAYLGVSGLFHTLGLNVVGSSLIGQFMSSEDGDGFAKVYISLP